MTQITKLKIIELKSQASGGRRFSFVHKPSQTTMISKIDFSVSTLLVESGEEEAQVKLDPVNNPKILESRRRYSYDRVDRRLLEILQILWTTTSASLESGKNSLMRSNLQTRLSGQLLVQRHAVRIYK